MEEKDDKTLEWMVRREIKWTQYNNKERQVGKRERPPKQPVLILSVLPLSSHNAIVSPVMLV